MIFSDRSALRFAATSGSGSFICSPARILLAHPRTAEHSGIASSLIPRRAAASSIPSHDPFHTAARDRKPRGAELWLAEQRVANFRANGDFLQHILHFHVEDGVDRRKQAQQEEIVRRLPRGAPAARAARRTSRESAAARSIPAACRRPCRRWPPAKSTFGCRARPASTARAESTEPRQQEKRPANSDSAGAGSSATLRP